MGLDAKKIQSRITDLVASFRAHSDLSQKDKTKITKADKRRIADLEVELKAILQPEERSDLTVDVHLLANFFGMSVRTVQNWTTKGCPKLRHGLYDLKAVFEWWVEAFGKGEESKAIEDVKLEYWRWKAENERMKAQQTKDELVPRSEIAQLWSARVIEVGTGLYALANRLPPLLEGKELREMSAVIRAEVRKLHESYSRTGRFCVVEGMPKPNKRKAG